MSASVVAVCKVISLIYRFRFRFKFIKVEFVQSQSDLLHKIGDEGVCSVSIDPSERGMLTRNTSRARVLFFFEPATPIRASTSALRSFKIPTQSTLNRERMVT